MHGRKKSSLRGISNKEPLSQPSFYNQCGMKHVGQTVEVRAHCLGNIHSC